MIEHTVALLIFLFPLAFSPGPGNLFFAANGARFGLRATMPASAGYHLATWAVTVFCGFGFTLALHNFPDLFVIVKALGSLYVLWLAWKLMRAGIIKSAHAPKAAGFGDGVVLLAFNPKAYFIIAAMFAQFLTHDSMSAVTLVFWLATIFTLNNLVAFTTWTLVGDRLAILFRSEANSKLLNLGFGCLLAMVAIWMFFS